MTGVGTGRTSAGGFWRVAVAALEVEERGRDGGTEIGAAVAAAAEDVIEVVVTVDAVAVVMVDADLVPVDGGTSGGGVV